MYGIIKNGAFFVAPNRITINGMTIVNPSNAQLESAGYFPVETTVPPTSDGMIETPHYEQVGGKIVQSWTLEPVNITPEEQGLIFLHSMVETATTLSDKVARSIPDLLPTWAELLAVGEPIQPGVCLTYNGQVYRMVQPTEVTLQAHQPPGGIGMEAIYTLIDKEHAGTQADPIPWVSGMDCYAGKYYSYNGKIYRVAEGGTMAPCNWPPDTSGLWQWEEVT